MESNTIASLAVIAIAVVLWLWWMLSGPVNRKDDLMDAYLRERIFTKPDQPDAKNEEALRTEVESLRAEVETLRAELEEARKWVPYHQSVGARWGLN